MDCVTPVKSAKRVLGPDIAFILTIGIIINDHFRTRLLSLMLSVKYISHS